MFGSTIALIRFLSYFRWFAWYMAQIAIMCSKLSCNLKKELFAPLHTTLSVDPELRAKKQIRILEIGAGSGL